MDRGAYLEKKGWIKGHITDLEIENHKNVKNAFSVHKLGQLNAQYPNLNFKIGLGLFGCAKKYTEQSTYCASVGYMMLNLCRDSWFLIIRGVQETDAGKYICQVQTD